MYLEIWKTHLLFKTKTLNTQSIYLNTGKKTVSFEKLQSTNKYSHTAQYTNIHLKSQFMF